MQIFKLGLAWLDLFDITEAGCLLRRFAVGSRNALENPIRCCHLTVSNVACKLSKNNL